MMRVTVIIKTKNGVLFTLNSRHHAYSWTEHTLTPPCADSRRCAIGNDQRVEAQCALGDLRADNHPRGDVHVLALSAQTGGSAQPWKATTAERYAPSFINQIRELTAAVIVRLPVAFKLQALAQFYNAGRRRSSSRWNADRILRRRRMVGFSYRRSGETLAGGGPAREDLTRSLDMNHGFALSQIAHCLASAPRVVTMVVLRRRARRAACLEEQSRR